jgi:hypothetical protein
VLGLMLIQEVLDHVVLARPASPGTQMHRSRQPRGRPKGGAQFVMRSVDRPSVVRAAALWDDFVTTMRRTVWTLAADPARSRHRPRSGAAWDPSRAF